MFGCVLLTIQEKPRLNKVKFIATRYMQAAGWHPAPLLSPPLQDLSPRAVTLMTSSPDLRTCVLTLTTHTPDSCTRAVTLTIQVRVLISRGLTLMTRLNNGTPRRLTLRTRDPVGTRRSNKTSGLGLKINTGRPHITSEPRGGGVSFVHAARL
jgi:hypothetical protein